MSDGMSSLLVDVRPGDALSIHGTVTVELVQKTGQIARLRVRAPREVQIKKIHQEDVAPVPSMGNFARH